MKGLNRALRVDAGVRTILFGPPRRTHATSKRYTRKMGLLYTPEEDNKIIRLRSEGYTLNDIAAAMPLRSYDSVSKRWHRHLHPSGLVQTPAYPHLEALQSIR